MHYGYKMILVRNHTDSARRSICASKSACIELGRRGRRTAEPEGTERETSAIWGKVLSQLWNERTTKRDIAAKVKLPPDELESLIWGLAGPMLRPERSGGTPAPRLVDGRNSPTMTRASAVGARTVPHIFALTTRAGRGSPNSRRRFSALRPDQARCCAVR
jgi:hypothetical protein